MAAAEGSATLGDEPAGLDALDTVVDGFEGFEGFEGGDGVEGATAGDGVAVAVLRRVWATTWPKATAAGLVLAAWQLVVLSGWKPDYVLPPPARVLSAAGRLLADGTLGEAVAVTMGRAAVGFAAAVLVGTVVGSLVARSHRLRIAIGSLITGIQTMPSISWFPLAILLFQLSERAILFVVVLGAAPAVANGLLAGADQIPPVLLRAGHVLGARGFTALRFVVLPAALPSFVGGLKQGWAFAWRSLMAGELLVVLAGRPSLGFLLQRYRELVRTEELLAVMVAILVIGIVVDTVVFGTLDRAVRRRRGLLDDR
jgi:NitT/TauT family transport system permease protein